MSTAIAEPDLDLQEEEDEDEYEHIVCCCDRNLGMCGADVSDTDAHDETWRMDDEDNCPKCIALVEHPCILCGYSLYDLDCACGKCWVWDLPDWQQQILRNTRPNLFI